MSHDANVISFRMLAFERGRKMFRDNLPMPDNRWSDDQWRLWYNKMELGQLEWLGYMTERGMNLMKQINTKNFIEGDNLDDINDE